MTNIQFLEIIAYFYWKHKGLNPLINRNRAEFRILHFLYGIYFRNACYIKFVVTFLCRDKSPLFRTDDHPKEGKVMKKVITFTVALMLLCSASGLAETDARETITMLGSFSITHDKLPEGYTVKISKNSEMEYEATIVSPEAGKPYYVLSMNFSDEWYGINTLNDATTDDINAVKNSFYEVQEMDDGDIVFEEAKTGEGTPLLIAKGNDGSFGAVFTIYMSHEIEIDVFHADDNKKVTDDEINTVIAFLTNIKFTPIKK